MKNQNQRLGNQPGTCNNKFYLTGNSKIIKVWQHKGNLNKLAKDEILLEGKNKSCMTGSL